MAQTKNNKAGYVKGVGRTFAPSLKADWVEEFNEILEDEPEWSRNRLTEHLIKKGLDAQRGNDQGMQISIPSEGLTDQQREFLNSEEGKLFLGNAIRLLLMQPGAQAPSPAEVPAPPPPDHNTAPSIEAPSAAKQETEDANDNNGKLSPLQRAKNKLKRQNI
ncbi:hypothetical protein [Alteribacillus sp. HJP-4]|uniref:hypothetical protein n=1 Tax=Alteribacillus sp. HJP-4 TaxID=2775394 RepID=UPI0035CCE958